MAYRAQDTFTYTGPDGMMRRVSKGDILADRDPLVQHDQAGDGVLFTKLDFGEDEPVKARTSRRSR